jgi:flagellar hook assembly protein FlgD
VPVGFTLEQNYPNPFLSGAKSPALSGGNPETVISYQLPVASEVRLTIFNALGQAIRTLVNGRQSPGQKLAVWDGRNGLGQAVNSGIYFYTLKAGERVQTKKMMLMR